MMGSTLVIGFIIIVIPLGILAMVITAGAGAATGG